MNTECSPYLQGLNKMPKIHLNTQYRRLYEMADMDYSLYHQKLPTRILPPDRIKIANPEVQNLHRRLYIH